MTFEKGISGNPDGRPKGTKDRRTIFREMIEPHRENLVQKAVSLALDGNEQMLRLLLDRLLPAKPRTEEESFDGLDESMSLSGQLETTTQALAKGEISSEYAYKMSQLIAAHINVDEHTVVLQKLQEIEEALKNKG